ncbi:MAG: HupE/UreJ family protein [Pseudomonadota bacterium]|nr:HupE/UreJ family protein [Pseudomonadota bacterium]
MKLMLLLLAGLTSNAVFAHAGHEHHSSAFVSGLLHPLSGLDHLLLALGLGLLLVRSAQFARGLPSVTVLGVIGLALSLLLGFGLGVQHLLPVSLTEYGIVASLLALAIALWVKQRFVALAGLSLLGLFHGVAHGLEVPVGQSAGLFLAGMLVSMLGLYAVGVLIGKAVQRWANNGSVIAARLLAVVTAGAVVLG